MGKRTDYAALRQGFGLSRGLGDEFIQACERNDVPIEAIHRLVTPPGRETMDEVARRILADWQAGQPRQPSESPSRNAPFSAQVVYVQPGFEELKRRFSDNVNPDYKGKRFDPIGRCRVVYKTARDLPDGMQVAFEYVRMYRNKVLAEMGRKGLRPALYEELLGFALKYPDEQLKFPIVALGSRARAEGARRVAFLWGDLDGRRLDLYWVDCDWHDGCRFLAVRE